MAWLYSVISVSAVVFIVLAFFFSLGIVVFHFTAMRHKKREKYGIEERFPDNPEVKEQLLQFKNQYYNIKTAHNRRIVARNFQSNTNCGKFVILVHGVYDNMYALSHYAIEYLKRGYDVLMYNQRATGGSFGKAKSFGYYEKFDLHDIAKFIRAHVSDKPIIVHGFSMGAATAALESAINEKDHIIDLYILDSPFSDLKEELMHITKNAKSKKSGHLRRLPFKMLLSLGNFTNWLFMHFTYDKVKPKEAVKNTEMPMLIIHAQGDRVCPVRMGEEIFDCKVNGVRSIWTPEESAHVNAYYDYPVRYYERVTSFIDANI